MFVVVLKLKAKTRCLPLESSYVGIFAKIYATGWFLTRQGQKAVLCMSETCEGIPQRIARQGARRKWIKWLGVGQSRMVWNIEMMWFFYWGRLIFQSSSDFFFFCLAVLWGIPSQISDMHRTVSWPCVGKGVKKHFCILGVQLKFVLSVKVTLCFFACLFL